MKSVHILALMHTSLHALTHTHTKQVGKERDSLPSWIQHPGAFGSQAELKIRRHKVGITALKSGKL